MSNRLHVGDVHTVTGTFRNAADVLANPTTTTLQIRFPDRTLSTINQASLTNPSTGVWSYAIPLTQEGTHSYHYKGTGSVTALEPEQFYVNRNPVMVS